MFARMATANEWAKRVSAWQASGLSADEYARGKDFRAKTLQWWSSELRRRAKRSGAAVRTRSGASAPVRFARVVTKRSAPSKPTESGSGSLVVRVVGAEIAVQRGFDAELLSEVVRALGGAR